MCLSVALFTEIVYPIDMTTDHLCLKVVKKGRVRVDFITGKVFSNRWHGKEMGTLNTKGYLVSGIRDGLLHKQVKIHRLIWIAKHGIPPKGTMLDHINGKKSDNRLINLRIVDAVGNSNHRRSYQGEDNPSAKIREETVKAIRMEYEQRDKTKYRHGKSYRRLAIKYHVSPTLVRFIIKKKIWKHV